MKVSYITIAGEKHPVCFSLSAIEDIEEEFGSLDAMQKALGAGTVRAVNRVLEIMLKAGRAYCAGMGIECPPPLKCRPGDLIDVHDNAIIADIFSAMTDGSERAVETKGKN